MTMQISPRGSEIDTDAKHEPKLLWNNSGGFLSGKYLEKEPRILRKRLDSVGSRDAANKDAENKQVLCLKIVKMQSFIIQISSLRIAIEKC